ncbi:hypothetical protein HMPREF1624_04640 [Sporothrix schenckii ATCC 58251]|uniref:Uncharacterized protein n=1 Tax=Sporothrix schenckii (strain ATCC 58251 / de Perez 2211183) TaxID=1391915 RepID=U7PY98_SPOS1|nr:hypothetical protein HMPREF1624_04640 [Sporothrix schenckii ATCC 58251]
MSSLFGPSPARLPSPASLLLEAWTNNVETKKLVEELLSREDLNNNETSDAPLLSDAREIRQDALKSRLAAFDRNMSVVSTVVTAIKALKKPSSHLSVLAGSISGMYDLKVPKRESIRGETYRLLTAVFFVDEEEVAWDKHDLVNGIDAITGLEYRRRQDLESIATKLGICSPGQLAIARRRMVPSLDIVELLIAQNMQAEYLFRTIFLGTRICTICHHLNENTNIQFVLQLLNALFPPYLATYPVPCIDVQEVRALRETVYLALMDSDVQFEGDDGGIEAATLQKNLLAQIGIDGYRTEVYPALIEYFARVESVKKTYEELHGTPEVGLDTTTDYLVDGEPLLGADSGMPIATVRGPDERPDSTASSQHGPAKSILKNSFSSMSGETTSTYASSYGSGSELVMHPLARDLSGLDEHELLRMGLALPAASLRSHQASFDSSIASPLVLANMRVQLNLADELQRASGSFGSDSISPSIVPEGLAQPGPTAVINEDDDVFATAAERKEKDKVVDLSPQESSMEDLMDHALQQNDEPHGLTEFPQLPVPKVAKSAVTLRERPTVLATPRPSERTMHLIKSGWKSTECLFAKFRGQEQNANGDPAVPHALTTVDKRLCSQRRPSKSVRFSDEQTASEDLEADHLPGITSEHAPDRLSTTKHDTNASDAVATNGPSGSARRPSDPWQYTRDYLLEKIKAGKEGRDCSLASPSPEWFEEMDGGVPSRQSIFSPRSGLEAAHKMISGHGRKPSLMRTVSSESSVSVRTMASGAPSSIGDLDSILLHGMGGLNQVAVGA